MSKSRNHASKEAVAVKRDKNRDKPSTNCLPRVKGSKTKDIKGEVGRKTTPVEPKSEKKLSPEEERANKKRWTKKVHHFNCKEISKDFNNNIKRIIAEGVTFDVCKTEENQLKSRYADILCIDQTRVQLKGRKKKDDFIHANWVSAPGGTKYICTQAPLNETIDDFWHMCYTEKVSLIVMLCSYNEGGDVEKCSHYFPEKVEDTMKAGEYTITMKEKLDEPEIDDTDFSVMEIKGKDDKVKVKHCFMRYWVDNCAPIETEPVLKLWRWVRKYHNDRPVVIHCSAGVGRTSTFVGIEVASYRIASNPDYPMSEIVKELRRQRYQSVQSHVQFLYLHCLVLDYFVQENICDPYQESKFVQEYKKHAAKRTLRAKLQSADRGKVKPQDSDMESK